MCHGNYHVGRREPCRAGTDSCAGRGGMRPRRLDGRPLVALLDYRKLCPKSGHALGEDERERLRARIGTAGHAAEVRCEGCGRTVTTQADPGTRRFLVYPMHVRPENL